MCISNLDGLTNGRASNSLLRLGGSPPGIVAEAPSADVACSAASGAVPLLLTRFAAGSVV
eukprot:CAMPEP_0197579852 /NCGR_PEP_ID=MMETSP1326-20131121/3764_1 /TAXON_ID=1155430 /ORGANISM="Genus nov. species nov., Strain RCC2288" /LENGTH=59 /DNA_ID=CAMNT_0043143421 /DNA_START=35 /DNA_END=214 /DNA_ORIENTATION=-